MFESPCVEDGPYNGSHGRNVVNDEKQEDICPPNEPNSKILPRVKLPHELYEMKKRRFENFIRSPFIEVKPSPVPSIDELKNRKNILDPIMVQMLRQVRPWVEV